MPTENDSSARIERENIHGEAIDINALREATHGEIVVLGKLIEIFQRHGDQVMIDLGRSVAAAELEATRSLAHTIKGSALTMGASGLAKAAAKVEEVIRGERSEDLEEALDVLQSTYTAIREELTKIARDPTGAGF